MQEKSLKELKQIYNEKLIRYNNMCKWLNTATIEEQLKQESNILFVILETSRALNAVINQHQVTSDEIEYGFNLEGD